MPEDVGFLVSHGFAEHLLWEAASIGAAKRMPASEVLMARGWLSREAYGEMLAADAGLAHAGRVPAGDPANLPVEGVDAVEAKPMLVITAQGPLLCIAAAGEAPGKAAVAARGKADLLSRVLVVPAAELKIAHLDAKAAAQTQRAAYALARKQPHFSALRRLSPAQWLAMGALLPVIVLAMLSTSALTVIGLGLTVFYVAAVLLRALMIWRLDTLPDRDWRRYRPRPSAPEDLPRYTILAALYREASQVNGLVEALRAIEWPADRKEVFLVCEADDCGTVEAIRALELPPGFHLVLCPPSRPRTKPKALNYALPLASGEYTVIYDAEDRPHRFQLREAHERFANEGRGTACLQAPLSIHNHADNWLTAMFAMEYETLFRGVLPILEGFGGPLPLGGTSNHFRTAILREIGEWDPWNVTEDADLGVRMARLGHRCGTLTLPTLEEAPARPDIWLRQRTRWLKGWIQTILVHSRNPAAMVRQIGWRRTALFHLVLTSIMLSALAHPFFLVLLGIEAVRLAAGSPFGTGDKLLMGVAFFNLAAGYTTYGFLAHEVVLRNRGERIPGLLLTLPAYWLMISAAGWRAAWQFVFDPFRWEKTDHGLSNSATGANMQVGNSTCD